MENAKETNFNTAKSTNLGLFVCTVVIGAVGFVCNMITIRVFLKMKKPVTYVYLNLILRWDTVRLGLFILSSSLLYVYEEFLIQLLDKDTQDINTRASISGYTFLLTWVIALSVITSGMEMSMSLERCLTTLSFVNHRTDRHNKFRNPLNIIVILFAVATTIAFLRTAAYQSQDFEVDMNGKR